jgi:enediyne polyketide synthase
MNSIAIVGMACRYPGARSADELWENVLAQRRAFRRIPSERLRLEDYFSADLQSPDSIYSSEAALIDGYEFDRVGFRVAGSTYRSADLTHWLALDVAAQTFDDAGYADGDGLPRETTGVFLGNTLTGEFSRANTLRLRWPYVRRVVEAALRAENWPTEKCGGFLKKLEAAYKEPFPDITEESLAGGLSNTIAGRICNYFNLRAGGYTIDGACSSSLLAVANACTALVAGDLDVALAGGVDLSLDPFELVGFAKTGALASEMMRIYDKRSNGFWPGEGCGFVLLMRHADALAEQRPIYALIKGWGISSDGSGGITRPEVEGQLLALRRAYVRANFGIDTVAYFEGHGTGTAVGDATELRALSRARRESARKVSQAVLGSVKAIIGHTKAAAGVAGLIKATMALKTGILPPTTGCEEPHTELCGEAPALRILRRGEPWPTDQHLRAGVSSMGFGGINAHIVLENPSPRQSASPSYRERELLSSFQDAELFLLGAPSVGQLQRQIEHLLTFTAKLSRAELADLAAKLERQLGRSQARAAIVAASPAELTGKLAQLNSLINSGTQPALLNVEDGIFYGSGSGKPRLGFLFPGQGSPSHTDGGALRRRFDFLEDLYTRAHTFLNGHANEIATVVAQPAIVTASMAGLRVLSRLNLSATIAIGHSLGELTALHWAGALDEASLLQTAAVRGKAMMSLNGTAGAMASIAAGVDEVRALLNGDGGVVIAGLNSPRQTVISGEATAVSKTVSRARARNLHAVNLPVSHAFHSPLVSAAASTLARHLQETEIASLQRTVISTVTGASLSPANDVRSLLSQQITSPVRFMDAVNAADFERVDCWLEVGPGQVLRGLMRELSQTPVISLDAGGRSLKGLLEAAGAAFALGMHVDHSALFAGRFTRDFPDNWNPQFFVNPCELAPVFTTEDENDAAPGKGSEKASSVEKILSEVETQTKPTDDAPLSVVRQLVAERVEIPLADVRPEHRLLNDMHLNSITVGQIVAQAARRLGLQPPIAPTDYADATVAEVAAALDEQLRSGHSSQAEETGLLPSGVAPWVRFFTTAFVERRLSQAPPAVMKGNWQIFSHPPSALAESLREKLDGLSAGHGVVLCLPPEPDENDVSLLLKAARAALKGDEGMKFVLVQHGGGAAAFARTLHLEAHGITTCVVDVPQEHPRAVEWVLAEALAATGYAEALYDAAGRRFEPVVRPLPSASNSIEPPLSADDVLVVTGGAKGITAECALAIAKETGVRLALIGLARPEIDAELNSNLERFKSNGIRFRYISADVRDAVAVRAAIEKVELELGPVSAILHGAARNIPQLLSNLDEQTFHDTLAVKVGGARNLLAAVNPDKLRLFISFSSIIARSGLPGEASYGLANEWLSRITEQWQSAHPSCRCLSIEWSIWSGVGMGARLGSMDALIRQGITPIAPDDGVSAFRQLLKQHLPVVSVVAMGRFRDMPTFKIEQPELPLLRFIEAPKVYYPNVELVVDVNLSTGTDPYLHDHRVQEERLLPAVMGLEAMAQVATALAGEHKRPAFEEVKFNRPIVVPPTANLTVRLAALVRGPGRVEVVIRSEETAFQVDHMRAVCRFDSQSSPCFDEQHVIPREPQSMKRQLELDPKQDLYGEILFHGGRFRRLDKYHLLRATECLAEITTDDNAPWFSQYLPPKLILGDPAARDAAIHAIQACIPHGLLLPIKVERISLGASNASGPLYVHARERAQNDNVYTYDLDLIAADGSVQEHWDGLQLRMMNRRLPRGPWVEPLLIPYLERRVRELLAGPQISVALERDAVEPREVRSRQAIQAALGQQVKVWKRFNGKPETNGNHHVSTSHCSTLTLAVTASQPLACDIEQASERPAAVWLELLGDERAALSKMIAGQRQEEHSTSATRVWAAAECLKKVDAVVRAPLLLTACEPDGWVLLSSDRFAIATYVAQIRRSELPIVIAFLLRSSHENL